MAPRTAYWLKTASSSPLSISCLNPQVTSRTPASAPKLWATSVRIFSAASMPPSSQKMMASGLAERSITR